MDNNRLGTKYKHVFADLIKYARGEHTVDSDSLYKEANKQILPILDKMLEENFLPGSSFQGKENVAEFVEMVNSGKHGLILCEHYSNFDLPALSYMLRMDGGPAGPELAEKIVAIAGKKLTEENPFVSAYAEAYNRIIIYPSRSIAAIKDPVKRAEEEAISRKINMGSMRCLDACRRRGQVIMVFPAGTRYRPGVPDTKRGVREIDSYLRMTDVFLPVSINGNCLRISEDYPNDMLMDVVCEDKVTFAAGKPVDCKTFRDDILSKLGENYDGDKKQVVVDGIMEILEEQHNKYAD